MNIATIRALLGMTQKQLADAIGVDQATISRIEKALAGEGAMPKMARTVTLAARAIYHRLGE
jgi:transcriptional regulator with XRE-family HTH domain